MTINITHGIDRAVRNFTSPPTVSQLVGSASLKAELNYGDNVRALVNGVEQPNNALLTDGVTVTLETRANSKATA